MSMNEYILELNSPVSQGQLLTWKNKSYQVYAAYMFPSIKDTLTDYFNQVPHTNEELAHFNENARTLLMKGVIGFDLKGFKEELRAKMFMSLNQNQEDVIAKVKAIPGMRVACPIEIFDRVKNKIVLSSDFTFMENDMIIDLPEDERKSLCGFLQNYLDKYLVFPFEDTFSSFFSEPTENAVEKIKTKPKNALKIPYRALFPLSKQIEISEANQPFFFEDIYCVDKQCSCQEVTCAVVTPSESGDSEKTIGIFTYNHSKDQYKNFKEYEGKFNAKLWIKKMGAKEIFPLSTLITSRQKFLNKLFERK